jgi:glycine oxidase ThiO
MHPEGDDVSDLIIVGGGIIGLAVARDAAMRGLSVTVLERNRPGREASWAAAGMLSPLAEASEDGPFLDFSLASLRRYRAWIEDLEEASGIDVGFHESGKLRLALDEEQKARLDVRNGWASERGLATHWLDPAELRTAVPDLLTEALGALLIEEDYRVDNRLLTDALMEGARKAGVRVISGVTVTELRKEAGRVAGVMTTDGDEVKAQRVLLAAGAWSGSLPGFPDLPVRPVHGQMLSLRVRGSASNGLPSRRVIETEDLYLVPRDDGRLLVGATVEDVGFRQGPTAEGIRSLLAGALRLLPRLEDAAIDELWAGLRPGTPDGYPIMGASEVVDGLYFATGHFRNGILLAPMTGSALGSLIAGDEGPSIPDEFSSRRFGTRGVPEPSG